MIRVDMWGASILNIMSLCNERFAEAWGESQRRTTLRNWNLDICTWEDIGMLNILRRG
jgi:hypothetical protein